MHGQERKGPKHEWSCVLKVALSVEQSCRFSYKKNLNGFKLSMVNLGKKELGVLERQDFAQFHRRPLGATGNF